MPRDLSPTGISSISLFEVVCQKAFQFARDCLCVLWSMPEHIWKAKCIFQVISDHRVSPQHIAAVHTLPLHCQPNRSLCYLTAEHHNENCAVSAEKQTGELAAEVQRIECVADCSWSFSEVPVQFAHHCGNCSIDGKRQSDCRSWSCLMLVWNVVYFPKGSASASIIASHKCKPLHSSHMQVRIARIFLKSPHSPIQTFPTKLFSCWIFLTQIFANQAVYNISSFLQETKKFPCPGSTLTFTHP